jgi:hypothetical protein
VHTAVFLLNRAPTNALDSMTPYQAWYGKKSSVHFIKVFRCIAYIKRLHLHLDKLDDHGQKVIFIGYQDGSKAYRFYDPSPSAFMSPEMPPSTKACGGTGGMPHPMSTPSPWQTTTSYIVIMLRHRPRSQCP